MPLARLDRHLAPEVAAQAQDRPVAQRGPGEDDGESQSERPPVVGKDAEARYARDREGRSDAEVDGYGDDQLRPAVAPRGAGAAEPKTCTVAGPAEIGGGDLADGRRHGRGDNEPVRSRIVQEQHR